MAPTDTPYLVLLSALSRPSLSRPGASSPCPSCPNLPPPPVAARGLFPPFPTRGQFPLPHVGIIPPFLRAIITHLHSALFVCMV